MGASQRFPDFMIGMISSTPVGATSTQINAAANRWAMAFIPNFTDATKALSKILFYIQSVTGTLGANDIVCDIYDDSATGVPGSSLESRNTVTTTPTSALWVEATGFTVTLTRGVRYWLVVRNANASPASNYFTVRSLSANAILSQLFCAHSIWGWSRVISTDSGSTWGSPLSSSVNIRLQYADSTYQGQPLSDQTTLVGKVYAGRKSGVYFTTPPNVKLSIASIAMAIAKAGTPTVGAQFEVYDNVTLIGTTDVIPLKSISSGYAHVAHLTSPVTLPVGGIVRIVLAEPSNADSSSNYWQTQGYVIENSAASKALLPFGGIQKTYYDGSSWAQTDTEAPAFWMTGNTSGEFLSQGGLTARNRLSLVGSI
jgi:hypothetical protein